MLIGEIGLISPDFTLFQSYGDIRVRREVDSVASLNLSFLGSATKRRSADYLTMLNDQVFPSMDFILP